MMASKMPFGAHAGGTHVGCAIAMGERVWDSCGAMARGMRARCRRAGCAPGVGGLRRCSGYERGAGEAVSHDGLGIRYCLENR